MDPDLLPLVIYVAVALIVAAVVLLLRDLLVRRGGAQERQKELGLESLLPSPEMVAAAAGAPKDESWLGKLAAESGAGFTAETALMLAIIIGLAIGGGLFLWRNDWLAAAAGGVFGMLVVGGLLLLLRFRRNRGIRDELPDVMELMARAVRAGESLDQAIVQAGNSAFRVVGAEFRYCANQMKIGLSLESAIRGLAARLPLAETRILAMTLIVQRRRGGNLPTTLERLAKVFRDRASFHRQFQAATALGRSSTALIVLVALGLDAFVILGHSEYARNLLVSPMGRGLLAVAVVLQLVGVIWASLVFKSEY
jgi:tight adherence protein B